MEGNWRSENFIGTGFPCVAGERDFGRGAGKGHVVRD
jgi:hypothetical protein